MIGTATPTPKKLKEYKIDLVDWVDKNTIILAYLILYYKDELREYLKGIKLASEG